ncbi:TlpA disulfide reductase family protein [Polaribacter vadi]|uniref:TlpA disulfide reductase family protein n=1 Tax=Polaribacter vadi TaxID=1774273 RepID=UPI0030EB1A98|tara:strand:+ start:7575 stop:8108 length:534 start_codon:yes stop_codon:yes gene_type:complete
MKKALLIFSILLIIFSCKKEVSKTNTVEDSESNWQEISTVKTLNYNELKPYLEKNDDTTYIVNFWATWCAPCVKELPYFEKIKQEYASKNVEVLLVSLDFPKQVEKKLIPFINKKQLQSEVVLLNDNDENVWIKAIDSTWSGALPATLIYNKNNRKFYEQSFDYIMLEAELKTFLKP